MTIPFNDLSRETAPIRAQIDAAICRVLDRGYFILGPECKAFEQAFADYLGVPYVIGVANGTEAIQIALRLTNGNRSAAARMLGISRPRLARKIRDPEQPLASTNA